MEPSQWDTFGQWMLANKLITAAIPTSDVMTTKYLPSS
jgi:hypothetical protein